MIGLIYLPFLALIHFSSGTLLGGLAALSAKALQMMRREDRRRGNPA